MPSVQSGVHQAHLGASICAREIQSPVIVMAAVRGIVQVRKRPKKRSKQWDMCSGIGVGTEENVERE